jgi:S-adenosylmethionine hydrolase
MKRKRVKNFVPIFDRCCAKRATNEQCTRRKKDGFEYCGTHMKGTPHGVIDNQENDVKINTQKIEVWAQDIQGIIYYIDKFGNVYQAEDIVVNKVNPKIIAKYVKNGENYSIPEFNL